MCANFVLIKSSGVETFAASLAIDANALITGDFGPGSRISIITAEGVRPATWWLFLRATPEGFRPHPDYFSVNTNYKKAA